MPHNERSQPAERTIIFIRHGKAKNRQKWEPPDHLRPLTVKGRWQAQMLAEQFASRGIAQVRTSPALRCSETVRPLALAAGIPLIVDPGMMEGHAINLPWADGVHVLCGHGDNIPHALSMLGIDCFQCRKASAWVVRIGADDAVLDAEYVDPPLATRG